MNGIHFNLFSVGEPSISKTPSLSDSDNCESTTSSQQQDSFAKVTTDFNKSCVKICATKCPEKLDEMMDLYIKVLKKEMVNCGPGRAGFVATRVSRTMLFFYLKYLDIKEFVVISQWFDYMVELMSFYCQLKLRAANCMQRRKESDYVISSRIMHDLVIFLNADEERMTHVILKIPNISRKHRDILDPIFRKLLLNKEKPQTDLQYIRKLFAFKLWKRLYNVEEKKAITEFANKELIAPRSLGANYFKYYFLPRNIKNNDIHGTLVTAMFDLNSAIKGYFKYLEINRRHFENEFIVPEKKTFMSELLNSFPVPDNIDNLSISSDTFTSERVKQESETIYVDDDCIIIEGDDTSSSSDINHTVSVVIEDSTDVIDLTADEIDAPIDIIETDEVPPEWCVDLLKTVNEIAKNIVKKDENIINKKNDEKPIEKEAIEKEQMITEIPMEKDDVDDNEEEMLTTEITSTTATITPMIITTTTTVPTTPTSTTPMMTTTTITIPTPSSTPTSTPVMTEEIEPKKTSNIEAVAAFAAVLANASSATSVTDDDDDEDDETEDMNTEITATIEETTIIPEMTTTTKIIEEHYIRKEDHMERMDESDSRDVCLPTTNATEDNGDDLREITSTSHTLDENSMHGALPIVVETSSSLPTTTTTMATEAATVNYEQVDSTSNLNEHEPVPELEHEEVDYSNDTMQLTATMSTTYITEDEGETTLVQEQIETENVISANNIGISDSDSVYVKETVVDYTNHRHHENVVSVSHVDYTQYTTTTTTSCDDESIDRTETLDVVNHYRYEINNVTGKRDVLRDALVNSVGENDELLNDAASIDDGGGVVGGGDVNVDDDDYGEINVSDVVEEEVYSSGNMLQTDITPEKEFQSPQIEPITHNDFAEHIRTMDTSQYYQNFFNPAMSKELSASVSAAAAAVAAAAAAAAAAVVPEIASRRTPPPPPPLSLPLPPLPPATSMIPLPSEYEYKRRRNGEHSTPPVIRTYSKRSTKHSQSIVSTPEPLAIVHTPTPPSPPLQLQQQQQDQQLSSILPLEPVNDLQYALQKHEERRVPLNGEKVTRFAEKQWESMYLSRLKLSPRDFDMFTPTLYLQSTNPEYFVQNYNINNATNNYAHIPPSPTLMYETNAKMYAKSSNPVYSSTPTRNSTKGIIERQKYVKPEDPTSGQRPRARIFKVKPGSKRGGGNSSSSGSSNNNNSNIINNNNCSSSSISSNNNITTTTTTAFDQIHHQQQHRDYLQQEHHQLQHHHPHHHNQQQHHHHQQQQQGSLSQHHQRSNDLDYDNLEDAIDEQIQLLSSTESSVDRSKKKRRQPARTRPTAPDEVKKPRIGRRTIRNNSVSRPLTNLSPTSSPPNTSVDQTFASSPRKNPVYNCRVLLQRLT